MDSGGRWGGGRHRGGCFEGDAKRQGSGGQTSHDHGKNEREELHRAGEDAGVDCGVDCGSDKAGRESAAGSLARPIHECMLYKDDPDPSWRLKSSIFHVWCWLAVLVLLASAAVHVWTFLGIDPI